MFHVGTQVRDIYPKRTCRLVLNHPTDSIDVFVNLDNDSQDEAAVILNLNGFEVAYHIVAKHDRNPYGSVRFKFNNPDLILLGAQNTQLSEQLNKTTLNMSRFDSCTINTIGCQLYRCDQSYFQIYRYPSRHLIYSA